MRSDATVARSRERLTNRARALEYQGWLADAEAGCHEAAQLSAERGTVPALMAAHLGLASIALSRRHLEAARAHLTRADEAGATLPANHPQRITRLSLQGRLALAAGEPAAAQAAFEAAIEAAPQQASTVFARCRARAVLFGSNGVETAQCLNTLPHTASAAAVVDESDLQPESIVGTYSL